MAIVPVVMSGGSGTRMWPLSRNEYPKQFLPLFGDKTMLQETLLRLTGTDVTRPYVICNNAHRFLVAEQLQQAGIENAEIVLEPVGRNTAPAITVAALSQTDPDDVLLVLAADHLILDVKQFQKHIDEGFTLARQGKMVTFGIVPDCAHTGYGYIQSGDKVTESAFAVRQFVEKPDAEIARTYVESGDYYWNSGMFMFTVGKFLDELKTYAPEIFEQCQISLAKGTQDLDFVRLDTDTFALCPDLSIDYAVMEKTAEATVIPVDIGWSDVGSWSSLWDVSQKDTNGNRFVGDVLSVGASNNFVHGGERLVTLVGVKDLIVVDTADALLFANRSDVQEVKAIVEQIKSSGRQEAEIHRMVARPWGTYDTIDSKDGFQVKRITVNPGASLSLQMHHHRAEHWIVVEGTAEVTCGEKVFLVEKNQSTYIPLGEKHRLRNPGTRPLKIIEVQSGDYLGEDDIVRFEDNYGRSE